MFTKNKARFKKKLDLFFREINNHASKHQLAFPPLHTYSDIRLAGVALCIIIQPQSPSYQCVTEQLIGNRRQDLHYRKYVTLFSQKLLVSIPNEKKIHNTNYYILYLVVQVILLQVAHNKVH